ncbi:hypothetical protein OAH12_00900 [Cyclobacteriaceae bacterium]|nr:hypothetical protein [Cyclobacteriaceae bacterium]
MDIANLNKILTDIVRLKNKLGAMSYSDETYDDIEDELHDLEDEFNGEFGEYMEDVLIDVHEELGSDSEILLPTAYLAEKYETSGEDENGHPLFKVPGGSGTYVENDNDADNQQLLLLPTPARFALINNRKYKGILWTCKEK